MTWFFQSTRRLYGSLAVGATVALVLAITVISVRLSSIEAPAPRTSDAASAPYGAVAPGDLQYISPAPSSSPAPPTEERRQTAQQVAVEAVEAQGHTAGLTTIQAQDGAYLVLEVLIRDGACTVSLIQDAQTLLVDAVTCTPSA